MVKLSDQILEKLVDKWDEYYELKSSFYLNFN